jgi:hypothetical protein
VIGKVELSQSMQEPGMSTVKQQLLEVVTSLPDDCTLEDFRYRLYMRQKAEEGPREIEEGRVHTHDQAVEIVKSWRKSSEKLLG